MISLIRKVTRSSEPVCPGEPGVALVVVHVRVHQGPTIGRYLLMRRRLRRVSAVRQGQTMRHSPGMIGLDVHPRLEGLRSASSNAFTSHCSIATRTTRLPEHADIRQFVPRPVPRAPAAAQLLLRRVEVDLVGLAVGPQAPPGGVAQPPVRREGAVLHLPHQQRSHPTHTADVLPRHLLIEWAVPRSSARGRARRSPSMALVNPVPTFPR